jgi:hypothetical protein
MRGCRTGPDMSGVGNSAEKPDRHGHTPIPYIGVSVCPARPKPPCVPARDRPFEPGDGLRNTSRGADSDP